MAKDIAYARNKGTLEPACIAVYDANDNVTNSVGNDGSIVGALRGGYSDVTGQTLKVVVNDSQLGECSNIAKILGIKDRRLIIEIDGQMYGVNIARTKVYTE